MSYDIYFIRRDPGQTFEDALDAIEESYDEGDPGPLTSVELEQWDRILPRARAILDQVEVFEDEQSRELTHPATGIELALFSGEVSIRVPHWRSDVEAVEVMDKVYALARAVESATGLEGYDPQLEEPVSELPDAEAEPARRTRPPADEPERPGGSPSLPAAADPVEKEVVGAAAPGGRRWWEFWRR
ncbi:MAG: hypothetical protein ACRDV1_07360 [Actinomycetes bacterium]